MKLATYKNGSRDGQLVVVSKDLSTAHYASDIAHHLQEVLDDWGFMAAQLQDLYEALNQGRSRHSFPFDPMQCMAPMPRPHQLIQAAAYTRHIDTHTVSKASDPWVQYQSTDCLLGPHQAVIKGAGEYELDFAAGLTVITDDVAQGIKPSQATDHIRLVMLSVGWTLQKGRSNNSEAWATSYSSVAVTPEELGEAWKKGRPLLNMQVQFRGRKFGFCDTDAGMRFHFGALITYLSRNKKLQAGTMVDSGPVSHEEIEQGFCSLSEKRNYEIIKDQSITTQWMKGEDSMRVEAKTHEGHSPFGIIEPMV